MSPAQLAAGAALFLAWTANGIVLRVRNWHRPFRLAFVLVALTAAASYFVLPQVTRASQSLLVPVGWVALLSLVIKLLLLARMKGFGLGASSAVLAWLLELLTLLVAALMIMLGVFAR